MTKRRLALKEKEVVNNAPISFPIKTDTLIKPANYNQRELVRSIKQNDITLAYGPAGTGKTLVSLFTAVQMLNNSDSPIEKIIYIRANVDSREEKELGALPGGFIDKVKPLAYPILDNLIHFMPNNQATYLIESGRIEISPLMMIRGRSLANTFILADEVQNISPKAMKTLLTRISYGSRMVLVGDPEQVDVTHRGRDGLSDAVSRLGSIREGVGMIRFTKADIVRHGLTGEILDAYEGVY
jgi:phosphate starvation-inducible protein PhoH and related proteins